MIVTYRNDNVLCHASDTNKWFILPDLKSGRANLVSCQGNLYAKSRDFDKFQRYEPLFNQWLTLKTEMLVKPNTMADTCHGKEMQVLVVQGEIYVFEDQPNPVLWKHNSDSNLWNSFPAFHWGNKNQVCVVAAKEYIYAVGGRRNGNPTEGHPLRCDLLSDLESFNTKESAWEKMASIQEARCLAFGTAVKKTIFIAGGIESAGMICRLARCIAHLQTNGSLWSA